MLLKDQRQASPYRGMPVEEKSRSNGYGTVTGDATIQLYYSNAGTRTSDAGQVAGVAVEGVLARRNILNSQGKTQATLLDTSLAFTSTALTTEVPMNCTDLEALDAVSWSDRLAKLTNDLEDGEYRVDYSKGILYAKKADNSTALTSTSYIVTEEEASADGTVDVEGNIAHDEADSGNPVKVGGVANAEEGTAVDEGDRVDAGYDLNGNARVVGNVSHDTADTGNPIKIGAKANAEEPAAVGEDDRANIGTDLKGNQRMVGNVADNSVDTGNPIGIGGLARSSQKTAVDALDRVKAVFNLFGELVIAGYSWATNSIRTSEINPVSTHYVQSSVEDDTNLTATTHYYYGLMDNYADLSLTGKFIDADGTLTLTLEVSNDEDLASADWDDVYFYDDGSNATVNSLSVTNGTLIMRLSANNNNFKRYRWAVVCSGATNTCILKERKKAL